MRLVLRGARGGLLRGTAGLELGQKQFAAVFEQVSHGVAGRVGKFTAVPAATEAFNVLVDFTQRLRPAGSICKCLHSKR